MSSTASNAIFFIGSNPQNPGYLGAEVKMAIGKDEEEVKQKIFMEDIKNARNKIW